MTMPRPVILQKLAAVFQDPPPELAFEIGPSSVALTRAVSGFQPLVEELPPSVLSPSPIRDNVIEPEALQQAIKSLLNSLGSSRRQRRAALILPDHSARVSVLDFDRFPDKAEDQLPLLQFRLKKTLPYDIDAAAISYFTQPRSKTGKHEVVAVATPLEVVARYEAPFRAANIHAGIVTISHLAMLDLVAPSGVVIVAKLSGGILTVMAIDHGVLRLVRSLELTELTLDEIAADLYPTFAYSEDSFGSRPETLLLCGFGDLAADASRRFEEELSAQVECLPYRNAGLAGYLRSRSLLSRDRKGAVAA
jgi:type IV pilus assembly protein PilM